MTRQMNKSLPFPEWSDHDLNDELWDNARDKLLSVISEDRTGRYKDLQEVHLPPSLPMMEWKRPFEIYPQVELVIYMERDNSPDLAENNPHLLQSEFMRSFISSVETLWSLGNFNSFVWEFVSHSFTADSCHPWRPWLYIYSKCKAGKGNSHTPTVNKVGKYVVRLFWLGSWRKIYIDDKLPVDRNGRVMLPSLKMNETLRKVSKRDLHEKVPGASKNDDVKFKMKNDDFEVNKILELWPFLLCKALMKLACLTWYDEHELMDFDIIQCLSGWIPHKIFVKGLSSDDVWCLCMKHTDQYEWPEDQGSTYNKHNMGKMLGSKDGGKEKNFNYLLMACYEENFSGNDTLSKFGFRWTHHFHINKTRNKPLIKPTRASDYPLWKRYRWLEWAANEGLIPPIESSVPIKSLNVVDPFHATYCPNLTERQELVDRNDLRNKKHPLENYMFTYSDSFLKNDDLKTKMKLKTTTKILKKPESYSSKHNFWIDFEELKSNIKYVIVYHKPSSFPSRINISEKCSQTHVKETKSKMKPVDDQILSSWKEISYSLTLKPKKNEPLYIFCDSPVNRMLLFNLSQTGCIKELESASQPQFEPEPEFDDYSTTDSECGLCLTTLFEKYKITKKKSKIIEEVAKKEDVLYKPNHSQQKSHVVLGKYNWRSEKQDEYLCSLSTYGSSTMVVNLKPGRHIYRLYIKSESFYSLLVISDESVCVGELYEILSLMKEEPYLLKEYCYNISKNFGKLIYSFGKSNFAEALRSFYQSCKPDCDLSRKDLNTLHEAFLNELLRVVRKLLGEEKEYHLKILFRRWQNLPRKMPSISSLAFCYHVDEGDDELIEELQRAVQRIQSLFRGFHERYLLKCHNPVNKHYKRILDSLTLINQEIFSEKSGMLPFIFRQLFKQPLMKDIAPLYPFYDHIDNTVSFMEVFDTNSKNLSSGWVFICRQTFFVGEPVLLKISLFCDLSQYFIKAFNNDTKGEMKYLTKSVAIDTYTPNVQGYTAICYGFSNQSQFYSYRLVFTSEKNPSDNVIRMVPSLSKVDSLIGNYIPNVQNIISRFSFRTYSDITVATIRLTTSLKEAKIHLKLMGCTGHVYKETIALGDAVIPAVILDGDPSPGLDVDFSKKSLYKKVKSPRRTRKASVDSKSPSLSQGYYIIEARILENSWPLTASEWKTVNKLKVDMLYKNRNSPDRFSRKKSLSSFDTPYWMLQIITNSEDRTQLNRDRKREDEILELKTTWFDAYPKRYEEAQDLRKKFLQTNLIQNIQRQSDSKIRSLNPNRFEDKVLPPFELSQYSKSDVSHVEERILKTRKRLEEESFREEKAIEDFEFQAESMREELNNVISKRKENFLILNTWFQKCRNETAQIMNDAANLRLKYFQRHQEADSLEYLKKQT